MVSSRAVKKGNVHAKAKLQLCCKRRKRGPKKAQRSQRLQRDRLGEKQIDALGEKDNPDDAKTGNDKIFTQSVVRHDCMIFTEEEYINGNNAGATSFEKAASQASSSLGKNSSTSSWLAKTGLAEGDLYSDSEDNCQVSVFSESNATEGGSAPQVDTTGNPSSVSGKSVNNFTNNIGETVREKRTTGIEQNRPPIQQPENNHPESNVPTTKEQIPTDKGLYTMEQPPLSNFEVGEYDHQSMENDLQYAKGQR